MNRITCNNIWKYGRRILTEDTAKKIKDLHQKYNLLAPQLAERFNLAETTVRNILKGKYDDKIYLKKN